MAWDHTTLVVAEVSAGGETGTGYTYADACIVSLIAQLQRAVRNIGREGLAATAIWDLKAKLLGVPLALLFGACAMRCRSTAAEAPPP
jgi:L-alanine-DL-glutamate epimerase-like enolase superfamily enzyme